MDVAERHVALHGLASPHAAWCERPVEVIQLRLHPARLGMPEQVNEPHRCDRRFFGRPWCVSATGRCGQILDEPAQPLVIDLAHGLAHRKPTPVPALGLRPLVQFGTHPQGVDLHLAGTTPFAVAVAAERPLPGRSVDPRFLEGFLEGRVGCTHPGLYDALGQHPALATPRADEQHLELMCAPTVREHPRLAVDPGRVGCELMHVAANASRVVSSTCPPSECLDVDEVPLSHSQRYLSTQAGYRDRKSGARAFPVCALSAWRALAVRRAVSRNAPCSAYAQCS